MIGLLIEKTLLGEINKEEKAIERIVYFQNRQEGNKNIIAFSGGKDSVVLKDLVRSNYTIFRSGKYPYKKCKDYKKWNKNKEF